MEKKKKQKPRREDAARQIVRIPSSDCDPLGSWTGKPREPGEIPEQDSDDL